MTSKKDFSFWINNGLNVLFKGKHGVGKTTMIIEAFEREGLKWKYFSASTMDPWVDFIGIPKEKVDESGNSHLELIKPKEFADDKIEAIFFDEFNRAPKKVRNAVMELIQFKSINGRKFNNLKVVWAAINPDDDEEETYDVEVLDPAQVDRFQVHVDIPYKPSYKYFHKKYGASVASKALQWWNGLGLAGQKTISPRRLDYIIDIYNLGGNLIHASHETANIHDLKKMLDEIELEVLAEKVKAMSVAQKQEFFAVEDNYTKMHPYLDKTGEVFNFIEFYPKERISSLISSSDDLVKILEVRERAQLPAIAEVLDGIKTANTREELSSLVARADEIGFEALKKERGQRLGRLLGGVKKKSLTVKASELSFVQASKEQIEKLRGDTSWQYLLTTGYYNSPIRGADTISMAFYDSVTRKANLERISKINVDASNYPSYECAQTIVAFMSEYVSRSKSTTIEKYFNKHPSVVELFKQSLSTILYYGNEEGLALESFVEAAFYRMLELLAHNKNVREACERAGVRFA